ncbi:MAG: urease accessory protein UreF [Thermaerobacter sp.]|nr:urease accessory protein UreF [Thermaerobacter sp.]
MTEPGGNWWALLQFADSAFPTGGFAYSYGLETVVQEGAIHDLESAREWLFTFLSRGWASTDGAVTAIAWGALAAGNGDLGLVASADERLTASRVARESRAGALQTGRRLLLESARLTGDPHLQTYRQWAVAPSALGNPAAVMGMLGAVSGWSRAVTVAASGFQTANALVTALVKLVPLGQSAGQSLLYELAPVVMGVANRLTSPSLEEIGQVVPQTDIAAMRHERLYSRVFRS